MLSSKAAILGLCLALLVIPAAVYFGASDVQRPEDPMEVVRSYLKAIYARDYREAYRHISSADKAVQDETSYLSQHVSLSGFALELARNLAEMMEIWPVERIEHFGRVHYRIGYRLPAEQLVPQPFDWEPHKLNELPTTEQKRLLGRLRAPETDGKTVMIEGQEFFNLVLERRSWKIFFDWSSATPVELKTYANLSDAVEARFVASSLLVQRDEPFQVDLRIRNRGNDAVLARVVHHFEPPEMVDYVDMIMCGALVPFALRPGEEREISSGYLLRDGHRRGARLAITYEFQVEPLFSR